jgi:hypothetical protein
MHTPAHLKQRQYKVLAGRISSRSSRAGGLAQASREAADHLGTASPQRPDQPW